MKPPKYARIGITEMRLKLRSKIYYRDAGHWNIGYEEVDGKFVAKSHNLNPKLKGLPIIEITKEEWKEGNKGYL